MTDQNIAPSSPKNSLLLNRRVLQLGLLLSLGYALICYLLWLIRPSDTPFGDFYGLWSAGRFAATEGGAVYDPVRLQAFQLSADARFQQELYYPHPYPPIFLLVLIPLSLLPLGWAYAVWMATTFGLYLGATLGRLWRSWSGLALLAAPTTFMTLIAGQNGFLTAALLVGGLRCLGSAPIAAGVLFGLLSYKPQFGLLVPVALLAARQGRAIVAATLTILAGIAASAALFGPAIWRDWYDSLPLYGRLMTDNLPALARMMPTIAASILQVTGSLLLADGVQAMATLAIAALVWRCFARSVECGIVPLLVGTVLATPYGFIYDIPMIASAIVLEWHWRRRNGIAFEAWEVAASIAFFESTGIMSGQNLPLVAPLLLIALMVALMRVRAA